jgi:hypothetical protein
MIMEQGIVAQVTTGSIRVEDDFGESVYVLIPYVVGTPRVGATCTLVRRASEAHPSFRAFVEPESLPERIASNPDESGVVFVTNRNLRRIK